VYVLLLCAASAKVDASKLESAALGLRHGIG
jgi:hypothetical protein